MPARLLACLPARLPALPAALAQRMALPQTACLALSGPLPVPETDGGRAWFEVFDSDGDLIKPCSAGDSRRLESLTATLQSMQQLLFDVLPAVGGWRPGQIQLLGFSQGGCVALELARCCKGDRQLGG
jgi:predicted esterase